jgi:hypothetical protein
LRCSTTTTCRKRGGISIFARSSGSMLMAPSTAHASDGSERHESVVNINAGVPSAGVARGLRMRISR